MEVPKTLKSELSYDPAILLLDMYPKEIKSVLKRHLCSHVYSTTTHNKGDTEST
jgi:hypothetical protein